MLTKSSIEGLTDGRFYYSVTYLDHDTVKTGRTVDVIERKRKYITAYCHLRNAVRTFKRSGIKEIVPA